MNSQPNLSLPIEKRIARRRERIARWELEAAAADPSWSGGVDYRKFCEGMAASAREKIADLEAQAQHARGH